MKSRVLAVLALCATAAAAQGPLREYHPRVPIDPSRGVAGDFSGTLPYWGSAQALDKHIGWAGSREHQWKLNWKFMDLDRAELHPGHMAVDEGEALVAKWSRREPGFAECLKAGGPELKGMAARHPAYDPALGRVVTVESRIEQCAQDELWQRLPQGSPENNRIAVYVKAQSAGIPIAVDIAQPKIMEAYRRGEELFYRKTGQLNFACASCHTPGSIMGERLRGEVPTSPFGDAAHYPTYRTAVGEIESLHQRFARCHGQMRTQALPPGDPAYVDLEVFLSVLSNGYPVSVPSAR